MEERYVASSEDFIDACLDGMRSCEEWFTSFRPVGDGPRLWRDRNSGHIWCDDVSHYALMAHCLEFWAGDAEEAMLCGAEEENVVVTFNRENEKARAAGLAHVSDAGELKEYVWEAAGTYAYSAEAITDLRRLPRDVSERVFSGVRADDLLTDGQWSVGSVTPDDVGRCLGDEAPAWGYWAEIARGAVDGFHFNQDELDAQVRTSFEAWKEVNPAEAAERANSKNTYASKPYVNPTSLSSAAKKAAAGSVVDEENKGVINRRAL